MFAMHPLVAITLSLLLGASVDSQECKAKQKEPWSYGGENGPNNWHKSYPICGRNEQSPIRFDEDDAGGKVANDLDYSGYTNPMKGVLKNNGHAIQIDPKDGVTRKITVDGQDYVFQQLHFHFGSTRRGSEHILAGEGYTMEMHLVHQNADNQLAVIGVFFKERFRDNENLQPLIDEVRRVRYYGDSVEMQDGLNLSSLLPRCRNTYYRYDGSLTVPPCTQGVKWMLLKHHVPISFRQMRAFRSQYSTKRSESRRDQCPLQGNIRPIQSTNGRTITLYNKDNCN